MTHSFLIIVSIKKPDSNVKSKMATINLHTRSDSVAFCVYCHLIGPKLKPEPVFYDTLD